MPLIVLFRPATAPPPVPISGSGGCGPPAGSWPAGGHQRTRPPPRDLPTRRTSPAGSAPAPGSLPVPTAAGPAGEVRPLSFRLGSGQVSSARGLGQVVDGHAAYGLGREVRGHPRADLR